MLELPGHLINNVVIVVGGENDGFIFSTRHGKFDAIEATISRHQNNVTDVCPSAFFPSLAVVAILVGNWAGFDDAANNRRVLVKVLCVVGENDTADTLFNKLELDKNFVTARLTASIYFRKMRFNKIFLIQDFNSSSS